MKYSEAHFKTLILSIFIFLTGCAPSTGSKPHKDVEPHKDGTVISLQLNKIPNQIPKIRIYDMLYWSQGKKVEAYVTEPVESGKYPLFVVCHGGYIGSYPTHAPSPSPLILADVIHASESRVELYPQYRGYGKSEGTVPGLYGSAVDTENAITAIESQHDVDAKSIYLFGVSFGGGVALKLASMVQNVRAVVAISPFVGWNIVGEWAAKNANSNLIAEHQNAIGAENYGYYEPGEKLYAENSPDISKIEAPVLLLQGTGDLDVAWQTVQIFYDDMKKMNKTVKLILYPGGQHLLNDKYLNQSNIAMDDWFGKYGLKH